tara:strand:+ start:101 stop:346 length:246 start_codon:yes stop_codon:yes gene_type:complete
MTEKKVRYKNVDKWVYGEVKEIKLIGEDNQLDKGMYYFVFWINHNNQHLSTHVSQKQLFDWFKINQIDLNNKLIKEAELDK